MRKIARWTMAAALFAGVVGVTALAQPPGGGRGFGGGTGPTQLVLSQTVQADLKLNEDQANKLKEWSREFGQKQRERMGELFQGLKDLPKEEMGKKFAEIQAESSKMAYKELGDVLKEDQVKRLKQIEIQVAGNRAFTMPAVQEALKLNESQQEKIREVSGESFREMADLREEYGIKGFGGPKLDADKQKEYDRKLAAITKDMQDKVVATLTDEQKATWKTLTGEPIDVAKVQSETRGAGGFGKGKGKRKKIDD
jgi:hypothetical protein